MKCAPIGIIHSPYSGLENMPIQPAGAIGVEGSVEIFDEYRTGLQDLEGFSHLILLYHFHRSHSFELQVIPFMDTVARGLFSTRAPKRPNPIGLSIVQLNGIEGAVLHIENVDILDGTPLLDIKPYVPEFDAHANARSGWFGKSGKNVADLTSDGRFNLNDG
ncbi:tRNA (N6-threonylcarbamoyladenosine(37)-N6)-methyltransferase TrmO [Methylomonas sp. MgM2]